MRKKGQHRGADGKFESQTSMIDDYEMENNFASGPFGNDPPPKKRAKNNKMITIEGDRKGKDPFAPPPKKRARGRPSGTGHVANVFYDS